MVSMCLIGLPFMCPCSRLMLLRTWYKLTYTSSHANTEQHSTEEQGFDKVIQTLLHEFLVNGPGIKIDEVENLGTWPPSLEEPVHDSML